MLAALQQILTNLGIHTDLGASLVLFGLVFTRMIMAIALAPFLGGRSVAGKVKVALAVVISLLLFPSVTPQNVGEMNTLLVMCLLVKEAMIGAILGFLTQIVFFSVQMAGAMVDYGRGMSQATFFAPQLETNVSLLGQLQFQAALVLFLVLNGHLVFLRALATSFRDLPVTAFPRFSGGTVAGMEQMARYTGNSLLIAIQLSAPVLLTLFLVDISFGMLGKAAAGFHVHSESQPVKSLVGLGIVLLALSYVLSLMPGHFSRMMQQLDQFVQHIR
jgi:flagellar biosynthesis protein FliR